MSYVDSSYYLSSLFTSESLSGLLISTQRAEKRAWIQTRRFLLRTPCTAPKFERSALLDPPLALAGLPHSFVVGCPRLRVLGEWRSFAFLRGSSKRNRFYGSRKGPEQRSSASCVWTETQLRGSKPTRTLAIWFHGRQTHLTHSKSKSSLCLLNFETQ